MKTSLGKPSIVVLTWIACCIAPGWPGRADSADPPAATTKNFDATDHYAPQEIEGWRVLVNKSFAEDDPRLCEQTLTHLRHHLYPIRRVVAKESLEKLQKIPVWVERAEPHHPCMCYHVDPGWLRSHGMNPEKARGVEIANAKNFLTWTFDQPWMVLHELAHGYHHQFLDDGYENADVLAVFRQAMDEKMYASVQRISGRRERHYAATNQMEYFAEASEAYFGTNDFFPFVRAELKEHDPRMFELLQKLWGQAGSGLREKK